MGQGQVGNFEYCAGDLFLGLDMAESKEKHV